MLSSCSADFLAPGDTRPLIGSGGAGDTSLAYSIVIPHIVAYTPKASTSVSNLTNCRIA